MKTLSIALSAEFMKMRRSWIFIITVGLFIFIPIMMGLFMYLAQNPELTIKLGAVGTKAQFFSENTWNGYLEMINQIIVVMGIIAFGFVTSWIFGREYLEETITDILALPCSRTSIVIAKFIIVFLWCSILCLVLFTTSIIFGKLINITDWSYTMFLFQSKTFLLGSFYTILLNTVIGFIASFNRGIIAPIGFVILMVIMSQFIAISGLGAYFPWAIPGVFVVSKSVTSMHLVPASYFILLITSISGFAGTILWWKYADQK